MKAPDLKATNQSRCSDPDSLIAVRPRTQLHGFLGAKSRFDAALAEESPESMFHALFEALNWAVAIDDRLQVDWAPEGKALGREWRAAVSETELFEAMRWARNSVHHDWANALILDERGFQFPMKFPLKFSEWVWKPVDSLPEDGERFGKDAYARRLDGRAARTTLAEIGEAFVTVTQFLDPPSPVRGDRDAR